MVYLRILRAVVRMIMIIHSFRTLYKNSHLFCFKIHLWPIAQGITLLANQFLMLQNTRSGASLLNSCEQI